MVLPSLGNALSRWVPTRMCGGRRPIPLQNTRARHLSSSRLSDKLWTIANAHRRSQVSCIVATPTLDSSLLGSRFGGQYAWPRDRALPFEANKGFCLLQANLGDIPWSDHRRNDELLQLLPNTGLLQVFLSMDSRFMYGVDKKDPTSQDGFRIVYHADVSKPDNFELQPSTDCLRDIQKEESKLPVSIDEPDLFESGRPLSFSVHKKVPPIPADYRIDQELASSSMRESDKTEEWEYFEDELWDQVLESKSEAWLLGHPHFVQDDVRGKWLRERYPDVTFESLVSFTSGETYLWGDEGEATILVPQDDLARFDLSRAILTWDSCS